MVRFNADDPGSLDALLAGKPDHFESAATAAEDTAFIAFTSGTTGDSKGAMHCHRDQLATCDTNGRHELSPRPNEVFCSSRGWRSPWARILLPMRFGAATVLLESARPPELARAIQEHRVTVCGTIPTGYRFVLGQIDAFDPSSLRACASAIERLPRGRTRRGRRRRACASCTASAPRRSCTSSSAPGAASRAGGVHGKVGVRIRGGAARAAPSQRRSSSTSPACRETVTGRVWSTMIPKLRPDPGNRPWNPRL